MLTRLYKFLGSLKLAVVLLTLLVGILAVATFYESNTSTRSVTQLVYRSLWFNGLLLLLAVNIAVAALLRWPWKRKHIGFVITHAGLIVLLGGCSAAFHYGTEGMMELHTGNPPASTVRIDQEAVTVIVPGTGQRVTTPVRISKDGKVSPRVIAPGLSVDGCYLNSRAENVVAEGGAEPNPALKFRLQSEAAQQNVSEWLVANSSEQNRLSLGPANVQFVVGDAGPLTNAATSEPVLEIAAGGKSYRFALDSKTLDLGDTGLNAQLMGYWPDFRMDENHKPSTASDEPNNPAALVIVTQGNSEQRHFVFANPDMQPVIRTTKGDPIEVDVRLTGGAKPTGLTVVLTPERKLFYVAASKNGVKSGALETGKPISPGWMDFQFTAEQLVTNALISTRIEPLPADPEAGIPALKIQDRWVRFGEPAVFESGGKLVHVIFGHDTMRLPFTVRLEEFVVERDEGSENVAGWTSKVIFEDPERGLTQRASIWMNHPAWFNGYKFSQASWNPNDLQYTALQVKKDPQFVTWLTWAGAALIVTGIVLLFWFRGWLQGDKQDDNVRDEIREEEELVTT